MEVKQLFVAEGHRIGFGKNSPTIKSKPMTIDECIEWADKNLNYEHTVKITRVDKVEVI